MSVTTNAMHQKGALIAKENDDQLEIIRNILYTDATRDEAAMILSYCAARKVDPVLKPIHLAPMDVKTDQVDSRGKAVYLKKRVIMPGIALYRIIASRTGSYAGISEPVYGEDVTEKLGEVTITYPKWCLITVKRIIDGQVYEFHAKEFWKENYASKTKWDLTPNFIWTKRPYGQIAKCVEAQALRKAFPEHLGAEYTYEEMEGKTFNNDVQEHRKISVNNIPITPAPMSNLKTWGEEKIAQAQDTLPIVDNPNSVDGLKKKIKESSTLVDLKTNYMRAYKLFMGNNAVIEDLMTIKNERKSEIESMIANDFNAEIDEANQNATV